MLQMCQRYTVLLAQQYIPHRLTPYRLMLPIATTGPPAVSLPAAQTGVEVPFAHYDKLFYCRREIGPVYTV